MLLLYCIRWEEASIKMLENISKGFPSCYANNVPVSRRVQMYIGNQKNSRFHLHSCLKVNKLDCYMATSLNNKNLSFETA